MKRKTETSIGMEFLMTYGWAILASIIVIVILFIYFRPSVESDVDKCLRVIAEKECKLRHLNFSRFQQSTMRDDGREFICVPYDNRSLLQLPFKFYKEEVINCKNGL